VEVSVFFLTYIFVLGKLYETLFHELLKGKRFRGAPNPLCPMAMRELPRAATPRGQQPESKFTIC
jgi:hypothetical protein